MGKAVLRLIVFLTFFISFFQLDAQTGRIVRQAGTTNLGTGGTTGAFPSVATITGQTILNPDYATTGNPLNYATTSPYTGVWTSSDDVTGSEIPYAAIPPYSSEPYADLRRGPSHLFTDFVPSGRPSDVGASYYMYYRSAAGSEALCFRLRMGSIIPGAKGYSILIDADGKFGATGSNADPNFAAATTGVNGNMGFELEVDLFTQTSGQTGIALYNVDGTSSPTLVWSANDYTQFSQVAIAGTNDNGDPDFYLDFFIPWNKITGISSLGITNATNLRFIPTTVMSPQAAIGGPKSDIYGLNDADYKDPNVEYEILLSAMPGFSITQLAGTASGSIPNSGNTRLCTAAPTITTVTTTGGTNNKGVISGTWNKLSISSVTNAIITVYLNGSTVLGTTTATMVSGAAANWTFNIPAGTTLASGDVITAKAAGSNENTCQTSNALTVQTCSTPTSITGLNFTCASDRGFEGTRVAGQVVRLYRNTATSNGLFLFATDAATTGTPTTDGTTANAYRITYPTTTTWRYDDKNTQSGQTACSGGSPDILAGSYAFTVQDASACESAPIVAIVNANGQIPCISTTGSGAATYTVATAPTITTPVYNNNTSVIGTKTSGTTVYLYNQGLKVGTDAVAGTTSWSVGTTLKSGDNLFAYALAGGNSCLSTVATTTVVTCITPAPVIIDYSINKVIAGRGLAGATVKLYQTNTSGTLLATVTVSADGTWTTSVNAAASTTYVATAQSSTCSVSAASTAVTTNSGITSNTRCGSITTSPITSSTTGLDGAVTNSVANTTVNIYEDGYLIASTTTSGTVWGNPTPVNVSGMLYSSGILTLGIIESGKDEVRCSNSYVVTCTSTLTPTYTQKSSNGTTGSGATVPNGGTMTYTVTNLQQNTFYSVADATTGKPYATGIWTDGIATTTGTISLTTNPLTSGSYNGVVKATSVGSTEMCTSVALASTFVVLPVTLIEFKGVKSNNANVLTWKTAEEVNSLGFEVEKSTDGINFSKIGYRAASGSNSDYSFTDNNLKSLVNYYRLRMVDNDGKYTYSKIILINDNGNMVVLNTVRPNPFVNEITISLHLTQPLQVQVYLTDAAGRQIQMKQVNGTQGLNTVDITGLSKLASGIYILKIKSSGVSLQEKLIKIN